MPHGTQTAILKGPSGNTDPEGPQGNQMKWTLLILLCHPLTAKCEWKIADSYFSEERCVLAALEIPNIEFKCRRHVESVPLPRPRPTNAR